MELIVVDDYESLSLEAARFLARTVLAKASPVLALPTGDTPKGLYRILARWGREGILDPSRTIIFSLDEYLGIPRDHPGSFRTYMREHLLEHVRVGAHYIPEPMPDDPDEECRRYEDIIRDHGGLDLAVLGLGPNGHIAFNEPGTPFGSATHVAALSRETRVREADLFGGPEAVPERAITMGIRTIMNAREILLLAAGEGKAEAVRKALRGPVTPEVPASVLQLHPRLTVILDREAAAGLPAQEGR